MSFGTGSTAVRVAGGYKMYGSGGNERHHRGKFGVLPIRHWDDDDTYESDDQHEIDEEDPSPSRESRFKPRASNRRTWTEQDEARQRRGLFPAPAKASKVRETWVDRDALEERLARVERALESSPALRRSHTSQKGDDKALQYNGADSRLRHLRPDQGSSTTAAPPGSAPQVFYWHPPGCSCSHCDPRASAHGSSSSSQPRWLRRQLGLDTGDARKSVARPRSAASSSAFGRQVMSGKQLSRLDDGALTQLALQVARHALSDD